MDSNSSSQIEMEEIEVSTTSKEVDLSLEEKPAYMCPECNTTLGSYYFDLDDKVDMCTNVNCKYTTEKELTKKYDEYQRQKSWDVSITVDPNDGNIEPLKPAISWSFLCTNSDDVITVDFRKILNRVVSATRSVDRFLDQASCVVNETIDIAAGGLYDWCFCFFEDLEEFEFKMREVPQ